MNEEEQAVYDHYWDEILGFMVYSYRSWILGKRDVNKDLEPYLVRLEKLGIQKVIDVMQSAYDRQLNLLQ